MAGKSNVYQYVIAETDPGDGNPTSVMKNGFVIAKDETAAIVKALLNYQGEKPELTKLTDNAVVIVHLFHG